MRMSCRHDSFAETDARGRAEPHCFCFFLSFSFACRLDNVSCSPINLPLRSLALLCVPMSEEEWIRSGVVFSYNVVPKPGDDLDAVFDQSIGVPFERLVGGVV